MCIEHQKFLSKKQCKKGINYLQLLSMAMLEMYRVVYLTVFSASGQQLKTEQSFVRMYVFMYVFMYVCMYVCTNVCLCM